jgi:hypothetical protein
MAMTPELEKAIRDIVTDVLKRELMSSYIPLRSVLPQKITPIRLDGSVPNDLDPLYYDATNGVVTF